MRSRCTAIWSMQLLDFRTEWCLLGVAIPRLTWHVRTAILHSSPTCLQHFEPADHVCPCFCLPQFRVEIRPSSKMIHSCQLCLKHVEAADAACPIVLVWIRSRHDIVILLWRGYASCLESRAQSHPVICNHGETICYRQLAKYVAEGRPLATFTQQAFQRWCFHACNDRKQLVEICFKSKPLERPRVLIRGSCAIGAALALPG